jgi:3-phenylpropionate/trans-cinnamate dioxygenase ferredoxin component
VAEFTTVAPAAAVGEGELEAFDIEGVTVAVANVDGTLHAFGNACTHRQCPLAKGELGGKTVTCPCHGSQFDVTTGAVLSGPAEDPVPSYPARIEDNEIQISI